MSIQIIGDGIDSLSNNDEDRTIIFKFPKCEVCIMFASSGDYEGAVETNLTLAVKHKCNILITATKTKRGPLHAIIKFCKDNSETKVIWTHPVNEDNDISCPLVITQVDKHGKLVKDFSALHELTADQILQIIKLLIIELCPDCKFDVFQK